MGQNRQPEARRAAFAKGVHAFARRGVLLSLSRWLWGLAMTFDARSATIASCLLSAMRTGKQHTSQSGLGCWNTVTTSCAASFASGRKGEIPEGEIKVVKRVR